MSDKALRPAVNFFIQSGGVPQAVVPPPEIREPLPLSSREVQILLPLVRHRLKMEKRRYDRPDQQERRAQLKAAGRGDAAIVAIGRLKDLILRLEQHLEKLEPNGNRL